jgi:hypothetical protein
VLSSRTILAREKELRHPNFDGRPLLIPIVALSLRKTDVGCRTVPSA